MLTVKEAGERILAAVTRLPAESVAIDDAAGRFLAADVTAGRQLPPWDNSAMDGFAARSADLPGTLPIDGTVAAGHPPPEQTLRAGAAVRIMTGAPLPPGADTVVMREDAGDRGDSVELPASAAGKHVRRAGEDVAAGSTVLPTGTQLGPGEIGLLAALGNAQLEVGRRPRVAILSTGDELIDVDVDPKPGQIVNSNAYALSAQVREAGGIPVPLGIAADDRDAVIAHLRRGLEHDVLCTSGGVSVGDFDFVKEAFDAIGVAIDFWKVAMKPGKPLAFGVAPSGTLVFGLPGNPVSSMVVFELFARPALRLMQGAATVARPLVEVSLARDYHKEPGRAHFVRASLAWSGGKLVATPSRYQGSGMLRSMVGIDALVHVPAESGDVREGSPLPALLLRPV